MILLAVRLHVHQYRSLFSDTTLDISGSPHRLCLNRITAVCLWTPFLWLPLVICHPNKEMASIIIYLDGCGALKWD